MHASFRQKPKYEALSYRWGISDATEVIFLNGQRFRVRKNLFDALVHLRSQNGDRLLWIDAVCIDQSNFEERKRQVGLMDFIYTRATHVLVWLGLMPRPNEDNWNIDFDPEVEQSLLGAARWVKSSQYRKWVSENKYWSRVWIIQEIGLARRLKVCTNSWTLGWDEFFSTLHIANGYFSENPQLNIVVRNFELIRKLDDGDIGLLYDPRETVHLSQLVLSLLGSPSAPANFKPPPKFFVAMGAYGGHILQLGPTDIELHASSTAYKNWRRGFGEHYSSLDDIKKLREAHEAYDDLQLYKGESVHSKVRRIDPEQYWSNGLFTHAEFKPLNRFVKLDEMDLSAGRLEGGSIVCEKWAPISANSIIVRIYMDIGTLSQLTSQI